MEASPSPGSPLTGARPLLPAVLNADGSDPAAAGIRGPTHPLADGGALRHLGRDGAAGAGTTRAGQWANQSADLVGGVWASGRGYIPAGESESRGSCGWGLSQVAEPQLERVVNRARGGLGRTQHRGQSPRPMGTGPTVRGTESEQDLGVASQMAGPSQKVECVWWAARGLSFERVQSPGLRVGPWVGPGSEWSQVTGWGLEWESHIKKKPRVRAQGGALTVGGTDLS